MQFGAPKEEAEKQQIYFSAIDGLKQMYKSKIMPVEDNFKYTMVTPILRCALCESRRRSWWSLRPLHILLLPAWLSSDSGSCLTNSSPSIFTHGCY
jgi:hypothetical protein